MARVTVEDCLQQIDNRFEMVILAARRARQLSDGAEPMIPTQNDKPTVIALREIAARKINVDDLDRIEDQQNRSSRDMEILDLNRNLGLNTSQSEDYNPEPSI